MTLNRIGAVFLAGSLWSAASAPAATNPMLHADGLQIVDGAGTPVLLRGVNLGGWLDWEGWMFSEGFVSETEIMSKLSRLAGEDAAQAFRRGIYSNYIAEADFRKMAELGFNSVRVPVNYHMLDSGTNKPAYQEEGWRVLDNVLDWCDRYHLYAIIDMHAAPGGQSGMFMADPDPKKSLWQSAEFQRQTVILWRAIAARYKSRTCVAGYDLINEPAPASGRQWLDLSRQIVAAIRTEDQQHLLFIEGGSLATDFSMFKSNPDTNMAYSFHIYNWFGDNRRRKLAEYQTFARQQNTPLWCGEFGENNYEMIGTTVKLFDAHPEISGWAFWPWKRATSLSPGLITVKVPAQWQAVMAWINHPLLHHKPGTEEAKRGLAAFLEAVQLTNTVIDKRMLEELLPPPPAKKPGP